MKLVLGLLMSTSVSAFSMTEKNPGLNDISINTIIDNACDASGYFNPLACVDQVSKCYNKTQWPKTVVVDLKLDVVNKCLAKMIR
jgi:hypothetical protein